MVPDSRLPTCLPHACIPYPWELEAGTAAGSFMGGTPKAACYLSALGGSAGPSGVGPVSRGVV
jgi:hypothetical protein